MTRTKIISWKYIRKAILTTTGAAAFFFAFASNGVVAAAASSSLISIDDAGQFKPLDDTTTNIDGTIDASPLLLHSRQLVDTSDTRELNGNNNNNNNNNGNNNNKNNNMNNNKNEVEEDEEEEHEDEDDDDEEEFQPDFTRYSLRLERCQYVKQFDSSAASNFNYYEDYNLNPSTNSLFSLQQFVVFRFCPRDSCAGSNSCDSDYGEYVTTLSDYLYHLTDMNANRMDNLCNACSYYCWDNAVQNFMLSGTSVTCDGCKNKCNSYSNLQAYGYVDAANYIKCTAVSDTKKQSFTNNDGEVEYYYVTKTYYIGPKCVATKTFHSSSSKTSKTIRLGVFSDSDCSVPLHNVKAEDVLGYKVNYHKFRISETGNEDCLACHTQSSKYNNYKNNNNNNKNNNYDEGDPEENENDRNENDKLLQFCNNLHDASAKCEVKHGFQSSMARVNGYETQLSKEADACVFVDSLVYDSYNAYGEIEVVEEQDVYDQYVTHTQKIAMLVLISSVVFLTLYGNYLHAEINDGYPTLRLRILGRATQDTGNGIFA